MYGVPVLVLCKRSSGVCEYMYNKTPAEMYIQDSLIREFKNGKVR